MKYCTYCGKEIEDDATCNCQAKSKSKINAQSPKNKKKMIAIASGAIVVILVVFIYLISRITSTVNLGDYITIKGVNGLNGQGSISYEIDEDALAIAMFGEEKEEKLSKNNVDKIIKENIEKYDEFTNLLDSITLTATPETGLSNGDKVAVTAKFENAGKHSFSRHIKSGSITYTVSDLADGKIFVPFAEDVFTISFKGFNGIGKAEYEEKVPEDLYPHIRYFIKNNNDLSNGDTVIVKIEFNESTFEELGYFVPEETEKSFTVSGLPEFLSSVEDIPSSVIAELNKIAMTKANETAKKLTEDGFTVTKGPEHVKTFFANINDSSTVFKDSWNGIAMSNGVLIMTHITIKGGLTGTSVYDYWYTYTFPNCYLNDSGEFEYAPDSVTEILKVADNETAALKWINEKFSGMTVTEIP